MPDTGPPPAEATPPSLPAGPLEDLLAAWLPTRRWYPAKGRATTVQLVADLALPARPGDPDARGQVHVLVVDLVPAGPAAGEGSGAEGPGEEGTAGETVTVQVPVVARREAPPASDAVVGTVPAEDGSPLHLCDGPQDPAFVASLLDLLSRAATLRSPGGWLEAVPGPGRAGPAEGGHGPAPGTSGWVSRVLSGEQSNTSVIVEGTIARPLIGKVFRTLQEGENPDILLPRALAKAGSTRVPAPMGHVRGGWTDRRGRPRAADLLSASEFLADAPDAWRTATRAVAAGSPFDADARDLGAATAEVHGALADTLPRRPVSSELLDSLADSLAGRVRWAAAATDSLDPGAAERALALVGQVRTLTGAPDWQRVHGDLHLGQVLRPPGRGWVLIDFEGEPLRPLAERVSLDTPVRDVASMLRSFDYAAAMGPVLGTSAETAGAVTGEAADAARSWARSARDAYCSGYAAVAGHDPREDDVLLRALELEKALYEVVYETRNRPTWVGVPLSAVRRLLAA